MWQRYLAWGVAAGLAGLVRPEFLIDGPGGPSLAVVVRVQPRRFGGRAAGPLAGPAPRARCWRRRWAGLAVAGPWLVFARVVFGHVTPGTATAKSGGLSLAPWVLLPGLWQSLKQLGAVEIAMWATLLALVVLRAGAQPADRAGRGRGRGYWPGDDEDELDDDLRTNDDDPAAAGVGPWSVWGPVALVGIAATWTVILLAGLRRRAGLGHLPLRQPPDAGAGAGHGGDRRMAGAGPGPQPPQLPPARPPGVGVAPHLLLNGWLLLETWVVPHARTFPAGLRTCYLGMGAMAAAEHAATTRWSRPWTSAPWAGPAIAGCWT